MELELVNSNLKTTSKVVAEYFGKSHKNVLRDIRSLECSEEFHRLNFELTSYMVSGPNGGEREESICEMTRDGFIFLAMAFTGKEAARLKERYITAFNKMEKALRGELKPFGELIPSASEALRAIDTAATIFGLTGNQKILSVNRATREITQVDFQKLLGIDLVNDTQEHQFTPTELGKRMSLSAKAFNSKLVELGFQTKVSGQWTPTEKGKSLAVILDTSKKHSNGTPITQLKWKESIVDFLN